MKLTLGSKFPNFSFDTPYIPDNDFYTVTQKRPGAIIFLRDADCLFTSYYLERLRRSVDYFETEQRFLICVVQAKPCRMQQFFKSEPPFPIVCDPDRALYLAFSLPKVSHSFSLLSIEALRIIQTAKKYDIEYEKSLKNNRQLPVSVLIGSDKTIAYLHAGQSITDVPDVGVLLGGGSRLDVRG